MTHTSATVARAVELHQAGWAPTAIASILERERGVRPSRSSIHRWIDPELAERERRRLRIRERAARQAAGARMLVVDDDRKLEMLQRLRAQRMSHDAVAKAMRVFFAEPITARQVEHALATGRYPQQLRSAA